MIKKYIILYYIMRDTQHSVNYNYYIKAITFNSYIYYINLTITIVKFSQVVNSIE